MLLSGEEILQSIKNRDIEIDPFIKEQIQPESYNLRVGAQGISTASKEIIDIPAKGVFELHPGDFGIVITREILTFDQSHTACIIMCNKYARRGIIATTDPRVNPGFNGRIKIGVKNLSSHTVPFLYEENFIALEIQCLPEPADKPEHARDQWSETLSPDDIATIAEGNRIKSAEITSGQHTLSHSISMLTENVKFLGVKKETAAQRKIKHVVWAIVAVIALAAALIALFTAFR